VPFGFVLSGPAYQCIGWLQHDLSRSAVCLWHPSRLVTLAAVLVCYRFREMAYHLLGRCQKRWPINRPKANGIIGYSSDHSHITLLTDGYLPPL
jgi:hypothetical protein